MNNKIDHIAIGAESLEQGIEAMKNKLNIEVPRGGKHDAMSTHNCVMQSGNESFFEIISIDPDAPNPGRTRWFTLDDSKTKARLAERPRALCWVVGTDDLDGVIEASPVDLGEVVLFTRGERSWRLTVPKDGSLPGDGLLPAFIEWSPGPHPSTGQQNLGAVLEKVQITHPDPEKFKDLFKILKIDHLAEISQGDSGLSFDIKSPSGNVILD